MPSIATLTHECFKVLGHLRELPEHELPTADALQPRLRGCIDRMRTAAAQAGFESADVDDLTYAIAALADEVVLSRGGTLRDQWLGQLLQLAYFGENTAGEGFFTRLEALRHAPHRLPVLEVYYLCLLFGFRGRYAVRGMELQLGELIETVRLDLERAGALREAPLAPQAERPAESLTRRTRNPAFLWVGAATLALSLLLYAGLQLDLSLRVSDLLQQLG